MSLSVYYLVGFGLAFSIFLPAGALARTGTAPISHRQQALPQAAVQMMALPSIDRASRLAEDAQRTQPGPLRHAVPIPVDITPQTAGTWEHLPAGGRLWRLQFEAPGATDLNFGFSQYWLPVGANLHILSETSSYEGPYTDQDNKPHGQLWTPPVPGDRAVLELFLPAESVGEPDLHLTQVSAGYRDILDTQPLPKSHGTCNNDVVCPEGDPWRDQIRSVARYIIDGAFLCTGSLIMDAEGSFRPFFLTANHCGVTGASAPSMVVFWNYEAPVCGQQGGGSLADTQTGATFRAARTDVDMALVELDSVPEPSFNVFYSGWDRSGTVPSGSVGIHHPRGDVKSISFNDDPLTTVNSCIGSGGSNTHWRVDNWEDGTTEPGSSGSGIWDPISQNLVGFLSGGLAACGNQLFDCYGKFSVAWNGGSSATERLRDWLDPHNLGTVMVDGADPATTLIFSDGFESGDVSTWSRTAP